MGVKACDRKGCDQILCDRLLDLGRGDEWYICPLCLEELVEYRSTWKPPMTIHEVHEAVRSFMSTAKRTHAVLDSDGIEVEFKRIIK